MRHALTFSKNESIWIENPDSPFSNWKNQEKSQSSSLLSKFNSRSTRRIYTLLLLCEKRREKKENFFFGIQKRCETVIAIRVIVKLLFSIHINSIYKSIFSCCCYWLICDFIFDFILFLIDIICFSQSPRKEIQTLKETKI